MMEIIIVVTVAYVFTGAYYILRELRQPFIDQPDYVRRPKFKGFSLVVLFGWLPLIIVSALRNRLSPEGWRALICFVCLAVAGVMVL